MLEQHRHRKKVVHRPVEEALNLSGVQVDAHDSVSSCCFEQIGDEPRGDGLPSASLLVLAGVGIEGGDHGDAFSAGALECIHHDELFHQPFINRGAVGLDDEGIAASHAVAVAGIDFTVGKGPSFGGDQFGAELFRHSLGESGMSTTAHQDKVFLRGGGNRGHGYLSPLCFRGRTGDGH